jgi:hypothetical protein
MASNSPYSCLSILSARITGMCHHTTQPFLRFLRVNNIPFYVYTYTTLFTNSSVNRHLHCFHALAILNNEELEIQLSGRILG